jgi:hypothetical protein
MGRLAQRYADLPIQDMIPYNMDTELTLSASTQGTFFPSADLLNAQGLPFAVHRIIPSVTALDAQGLPLATQPSEYDVLFFLVSLRIELQGLNMNVTKTPVRLKNLVKGPQEMTWELAEPVVLPNGYGMLMAADVGAFPAGVTYSTLQVAMNLQGFLLQVGPPGAF